MRIDAKGSKLRHRFVRGLMRSRGAADLRAGAGGAGRRAGRSDGAAAEPVIRPLYGAFRALLKARDARGTLDLDLPERRVLLDEDGRSARSCRARGSTATG